MPLRVHPPPPAGVKLSFTLPHNSNQTQAGYVRSFPQMYSVSAPSPSPSWRRFKRLHVLNLPLGHTSSQSQATLSQPDTQFKWRRASALNGFHNFWIIHLVMFGWIVHHHPPTFGKAPHCYSSRGNLPYRQLVGRWSVNHSASSV